MTNGGNLSLELGPSGDVQIIGPLVFANAADALPRGVELIVGNRENRFDLSGVTLADSAGLALLIEWRRVARRHDATLVFSGATDQLLNIAGTTNLSALFDVGDNT